MISLRIYAFLCMMLVIGPVSTAMGAGPQRGVVAAATPEATTAGVDILRAGGNAIDAAVAVSFTLGVTEPAGSGLGGALQMIVYPPSGEPFVINGTSYSPSKLPAEIEDEHLKSGHTATTVPSLVKALGFVFEKYGSKSLSWAEVLAPAIQYAEIGYPVVGFRHRSLEAFARPLRLDAAAAQYFLQPDGLPHRRGTVIRQPVLAETLRRLARHGADDFYTGGLARDIAEDMATHGGWITLEDLQSVANPPVLEPRTAIYRGWSVHTVPHPAGGRSVLKALSELGKAPPEELNTESETRMVRLLEALKVAHTDRRNNPVPGGETTHFSIVDRSGMAVAVTQSLNAYYGAKAANAKLGFLYNNYMSTFRDRDADHPYALAPKAPPYSSMSATIVARGGEAYLAIGSPGSARIVSAVTQVISHWIDIGNGIGPAVEAYRVHATPDNEAYIEQPHLTGAALRLLADRGFDLKRADFKTAEDFHNPYFGGVHAVARDGYGWRGAADLRRDGRAGYAEAAVN